MEKKTDYKTSCIMLNFSMGGCEFLLFLFLIGYIILSYFYAFLESWTSFLHQPFCLMILKLVKFSEVHFYTFSVFYSVLLSDTLNNMSSSVPNHSSPLVVFKVQVSSSLTFFPLVISLHV